MLAFSQKHLSARKQWQIIWLWSTCNKIQISLCIVSIKCWQSIVMTTDDAS